MTRLVAGIEPLAESCEAMLVDQFGVLHDGRRMFPGAIEALRYLKDAGRPVIILSNSGKRAAVNADRMSRMGLSPDLYQSVMSSGEAAWRGFARRDDPDFARFGGSVLLISRGGDQSAIAGLDLRQVDTVEQADFVWLAGIDAGPARHRRCRRTLDEALAGGLPLLCSNPDLISMDGDHRGEGPGAFAGRYAAGGGTVVYVGKPWPAIYRAALAELGMEPDRVLGVGDSLHHDILGARNSGMDGALVGIGIHSAAFARCRTDADVMAALDALGATARPKWFIHRFGMRNGDACP